MSRTEADRLLVGRLLLGTLLLGTYTTACAGGVSEREQWLVTVTTDLPVPRFADRLLIEVLAADGAPTCSTCSRVIGFTRADVFPLSFGVPREGNKVRLRLRLHHAAALAANGQPEPESTIDQVVILEGGRGKSNVRVALRTSCIGFATDLANNTTCINLGVWAPEPVAAIAASPEATAALMPWPGANARPCSAPELEGTSCIAGGAFFLGSPSDGALGLFNTGPERLVVAAPFRLDRTEFTVGQARKLARTLPAIQLLEATKERPECTYRGPDDASADAMPLNCVSRLDAMALCKARNMRLPTEVEWEFAAGNRGLETRFPWGNAAATCSRTHVARALSYPVESDKGPFSTTCRLDGSSWGAAGPRAVPAGLCAAETDCTRDAISDLAGNLREFVEDRFAPFADACWAKPGVLANPVCKDTAQGTVRGGSFRAELAETQVTQRLATSLTGESEEIGFRCAVSAE